MVTLNGTVILTPREQELRNRAQALGNDCRYLLVGAGNAKRLRSFLHHIDVNTHKPRTTTNRNDALPVSAEMAETLRFNLTARGYRVQVVW